MLSHRYEVHSVGSVILVNHREPSTKIQIDGCQNFVCGGNTGGPVKTFSIASSFLDMDVIRALGLSSEADMAIFDTLDDRTHLSDDYILWVSCHARDEDGVSYVGTRILYYVRLVGVEITDLVQHKDAKVLYLGEAIVSEVDEWGKKLRHPSFGRFEFSPGEQQTGNGMVTA